MHTINTVLHWTTFSQSLQYKNSFYVNIIRVVSHTLSIGYTTSMWRLCDLSSTGKFGQGGAEAKLSHGRQIT